MTRHLMVKGAHHLAYRLPFNYHRSIIELMDPIAEASHDEKVTQPGWFVISLEGSQPSCSKKPA